MYKILKRWSSAKICGIVLDERLREQFCERLKQELVNPSYSSHPVYRSSNKGRDSAVLIPLVYIKKSPSIIFTHRSLLLTSHRGEVSFPGGRLEQGETYEQVCLLNHHFLHEPDSVLIIVLYHALQMIKYQ